jgi:RNA polymerase sigma factor (sigma-70 family)
VTPAVPPAATSRSRTLRRSHVVGLPPFQELLDRHADEVYRFLVAAVGRQEAADCFQETVLSALRAYRRLRNGENLRGWLLTIARRKAIDEHRGRVRRPAPVADIRDGDGASLADPEPGLWAAVRRLPPKQRAAVLFRYVNDLPHREIGRLLGCSEEENLRRLIQPGRAERLKLTDARQLAAMRARYRLLRAVADINLELDVTALLPLTRSWSPLASV